MLLTIETDTGSKIPRNSVFDCHLSPVKQQMEIENSVSNDFLSSFVDSFYVFDSCLSGVILHYTLCSLDSEGAKIGISKNILFLAPIGFI